MPLIFRLEDSLVTSNFHSLARRCILSTSSDNQICIALIDKIYTFKHVSNCFKLTCRLNTSSVPRNDINKYNQLKLESKNNDYYSDLQRLMCTYCTSDNPRFVWTSWTPKCKLGDEIDVCLLCTITINNSINLWIPSEDVSGTDLYKLESVLNLTNSLMNEVSSLDFEVFWDDLHKEDSRRRILFNLSTTGFPSCHFAEDYKSREHGFLCVVNIVDYILLVWVTKMKTMDEKKEESEVRTRRSSRTKRINIEDISDLYEEEEEESPKRKKKGSEKVLGVPGFSALNKDYYDLEYFDVTKCKDLFPITTKVTQSNLLNSRTIAAVRVDSCTSLVAVHRNDLNFDVYYTDPEGIKSFNLQFDINVNNDFLKINRPRVGEMEAVFVFKKSLEGLKHFLITGRDENEFLTGFYESSFVVHDLKGRVTRQVECGSLPLVSYSLEHLFMDQGNLALINVVNSEGAVYRLLMDSELKVEVEEVVDKGQEFVPCFTASGCDELMVYDCLMKRSLFEVNYNLGNKSIFYNLVLLLSKNAELDLFLDYFCNQRSNLVPNNTFFTVTEAQNPFHKLTRVKELLDLENTNDEFYTSLLSSNSCDCHESRVLTCFTLYIFAFIEASAALPFDKNVALSSTINCGQYVSRMLRGVRVDTSKLLKIFEILNRIYKSKFLRALVGHLTA